MNRVIAAVAAAGILVAGAFVASTVASDPADAQTSDTTIVDDGVGPVEGVLDDLVADGVLTQDQADAVLSALRDEWEERRTEREARREERRAERDLIRGFLSDDVIDADELAQLDDDHPFNDPDGPFADAAADGEITVEELREIRGDHRDWHRRYGPFGPSMDGAGDTA